MGREGIIQSCHEDLRTLYKMTVDYYFQFMPEGLERRIRGNNSELIFPEMPKREDFATNEEYDDALEQAEKQKFYNRDMLIGIGKWDFKWNGTQLSGDRETQIQLSDQLAALLPKFPQLVSLTNIWELLRDILIARGKKDWQKYIIPKEKVQLAEQQAQEQAANSAKPPSESISFSDLPPEGKIQMAAKAGIKLSPEGVMEQEQQSNTPALRDKLIAKGFPPEVVDMAIAKMNGQGGNVPQGAMK